jgi:hypothetical protein
MRPNNGRDDGGKTAPVWQLCIEERLVRSELATEFVGDHIKARQQLPDLELHFGRGVQFAVTFVPPHTVGITHDLADAVVQEQRLDGAKERKYQLEAHSVLREGGSPEIPGCPLV